MLLNPFPPLPNATVYPAPARHAGRRSPGPQVPPDGGTGPLQLGAPRCPLPLKGAGVGAVGVTTEARNLGWNLQAAFGPAVPGWTQLMPAGFSARSGAHSGCCPAWAF